MFRRSLSACIRGDGGLQLFGCRLAKLDCFQVELNGRQRGFQFVGDLIDEIALGVVQ